MRFAKFITIEGFFGSGKTSVLRKLKKSFTGSLFIKEPGATYEGKEINKIINSKVCKLEKESFDLLHVVSLLETSKKLIVPHRSLKDFIFSERWYYYIKANQYYPYRQDMTTLNNLMDNLGVCHPDINIILHSPFDVCMERLSVSKQGSGFIGRGEKFLRDVYTYYYTECAGIQIDSNRNLSKVVSDIIKTVRYCID